MCADEYSAMLFFTLLNIFSGEVVTLVIYAKYCNVNIDTIKEKKSIKFLLQLLQPLQLISGVHKRRPQSGGRGVCPAQTREEEGGSIFRYYVRTSFMEGS